MTKSLGSGILDQFPVIKKIRDQIFRPRAKFKKTLQEGDLPGDDDDDRSECVSDYSSCDDDVEAKMAIDARKKYKNMMKQNTNMNMNKSESKLQSKKGQKAYVDFDIMQKQIEVSNINKQSIKLYRQSHMSYKQWIEH